MAEEDRYRVEQFTLDPSAYRGLADLIATAFVHDSQDTGGTIAFSAETFNLMFGSPTQPRDLFVRAVARDTGEVVGFMGGIPRDISYRGEVYRFGVPSWASVHSQHQRQGLALRMGLRLLEVGKEKGFVGGISMFEPEAHGIDTARSVARERGLAYREIFTIRKFVIRALDVARLAQVVKLKTHERWGLRLLQGQRAVHNPRVRLATEKDVELMFALTRDHQERNQLALARDRDDFAWYLKQPGVHCVVHEEKGGAVDGFLAAWRMNLAGFGKQVPCGWIDLVHTHRLPRGEARDLCAYLGQTSKELGWAGLQTPFIPYFDPRPFRKARFVFFPKSLVVGMFDLQGQGLPFPERIDSFYFDWR
jgi:GNAT superfamily N-acetyltransferase